MITPEQDVKAVAARLYGWFTENRVAEFDDVDQEPWLAKARELIASNTGTGAIPVHFAARPYAEKVQDAILRDFPIDTLRSITGFSNLHDHCDANMYLVDVGLDFQRDDEEDVWLALSNAVTDIVDVWLRDRLWEQPRQPYSRCVNCGRTIFWDYGDVGYTTETGELICEYGDEFTSGPDRGHQAMWLTLAEFRAKTKHLPDNMPITADAQGDRTIEGGYDWFNVILRDVPDKWDPQTDQPSLILDLRNDFDTRQW